MHTLAAIGEAMLELSHEDERRLALGFAGDSLNFSIYFARLMGSATQVHYVTALGTDPYSAMILSELQAEQIATDLIYRLPDKLPGLYLIRTNASGERTFYFYRNQSAARELFSAHYPKDYYQALLKMDYLFLTLISIAILTPEKQARLFELLAEAKAKGVKIVVDTNYRPALWLNLAATHAVLAKLVPMADILFATFDDEQAMYNDPTPEVSAQRLFQQGAKEVIIKNGAKPAIIMSHEISGAVPAQKQTRVIDTTAAGDSFNAGYLAARLQGKSPLQAAGFGHQLANLVIQFRGAICPRQQMPKLF